MGKEWNRRDGLRIIRGVEGIMGVESKKCSKEV